MDHFLLFVERSVSGGFFNFLGHWLMLGLVIAIPCQTLIVITNRPLRHWNIRKHGYPPAHCDADGDFKKVE